MCSTTGCWVTDLGKSKSEYRVDSYDVKPVESAEDAQKKTK